MVRQLKTEYFTSLFDEVKDCRSNWKLVKNAFGSQADQTIKTSDLEKAASGLFVDKSQEKSLSHITCIRP